MSTVRKVVRSAESKPTLEGAGVRLRRAFGHGEHERFDPFLMLDDFRSDQPAAYQAGFPWHPHRGIETITYMLEGEVEHGDSLGNVGIIRRGEVQWMTAGSGVVHQEMPHGDPSGRMGGFQLWANLPAAGKMTAPRYRGIKAAEIPEVAHGGVRVRVIAGRFGEATGPVADVAIRPEYFDVSLESGATWTHPTEHGRTAFVYLFEGEVRFGESDEALAASRGTVVLLGDGDEVRASAGPAGARFLFASGQPLREPIAWGGPIVMNTSEELAEAFRELDEGTFLKE